MTNSINTRIVLLALVVSLTACLSFAQQNDTTTTLKTQITQLQIIARNPASTPSERAASLRLIALKRAQLVASLKMQIDSLEAYQGRYGSRFTRTENQRVADSIALLQAELRNWQVGAEASHATPNYSAHAPVGPSSARVRLAVAPTSVPPVPKANSSNEVRSRVTNGNDAFLVRVQSDGREYGSGQPNDRDQCAGIPTSHYIYLDWRSGSVTPSRLKRSGTYCFVLTEANTILYDYGFTVNVQNPQGSPLGILKDAISELGKLSGEAAKAVDSANKANFAQCDLKEHLDRLTTEAGIIDARLSAVEPPPQEGGKVKSVTLAATLKAWGPVAEKFNDFKNAGEALERKLASAAPSCDADIRKKSTEAVRQFYRVLSHLKEIQDKVNANHVAKFRDSLDSTKGYDVVVRELYDSRQTDADPKIYHLSAGYSVISSSAGFMLTKVPARSYSSVTAPNPTNPTTTQNVLGVDYGSGTRAALGALLHYNFPFFGNSHFGLALSAGPIYDITGGKADTSRFGFFAGPSIRLSEWVYVTPGAHVGEFADFPRGFTEGQVIPTGIGTPTPSKRYTTKFALGITFKVKDLVGAGSSSGSDTPASQPKPKG